MPRKLKRGNNEGSISLRKDGRWEARVSLGWRDGKQHRKSYFGKTRKEAADKLAAALMTHQQGLTLHDERQTTGAFLTRWLEDVVRQRSRASTIRSYEGIVRVHLIPGIGHIPIVKLTPQLVSAFLKRKHEAGISAEHIRRVLRAALTTAVRWDMIPRNAASLASCPKKAKAETRFLDPEQARALLTALKGHQHEALYSVALAVGLRLGECLGLQWGDLDLQSGTLTVKRQIQRVNGKLQFVELKTRNARRTVPIPRFAVEALQALWARQELQDKPFAGERWQGQSLVFTSGIGTPCDERNIRRSLAAILKEHNLPRIRFHDLRHSCATLLLSQGTDPRTIMQTLGHSQISLTLGTYSHVIPQLQRDAADKMQKMFDTKDPVPTAAEEPST